MCQRQIPPGTPLYSAVSCFTASRCWPAREDKEIQAGLNATMQGMRAHVLLLLALACSISAEGQLIAGMKQFLGTLPTFYSVDRHSAPTPAAPESSGASNVNLLAVATNATALMDRCALRHPNTRAGNVFLQSIFCAWLLYASNLSKSPSLTNTLRRLGLLCFSKAL